MSIAELRHQYHQRICNEIIRIKDDDGYPNFADGSNRSSVSIAWEILQLIGCDPVIGEVAGQTTGSLFEKVTREFIEEAFGLIKHLRPGDWFYETTHTEISNFDQYQHLTHLEQLVGEDINLKTSLGSDYIVKPDVVIGRQPVSDSEINRFHVIVDDSMSIARHTPFRQANFDFSFPILHASISCKWTIRSDRSQNTRTEALNLVRNRKGHLPHIVVVTAEPLPTRLSTLALGTGDLDCVYHFALPELEQALRRIDNVDQLDMLTILINGRRLRDISDLPFDLAV